MREHFEHAERAPYFELNSMIHERVLAIANNPVLQETHARLNARASRGRFIAIVDDLRWREAMQEHEGLMQALRDRAPDTALEIWRAHLMNTGAAVRRAQLADGVISD